MFCFILFKRSNSWLVVGIGIVLCADDFFRIHCTHSFLLLLTIVPSTVMVVHTHKQHVTYFNNFITQFFLKRNKN